MKNDKVRVDRYLARIDYASATSGTHRAWQDSSL
jgi:hypothetical protein